MLKVDFLGTVADENDAPMEVAYGSIVMQNDGRIVTLPLADQYAEVLENILDVDVVVFDKNDNPKAGYNAYLNTEDWMKNAYKQFSSPYFRATKAVVVNEK